METGLCVDNYFFQIDNNTEETRAKTELLRERKIVSGRVFKRQEEERDHGSEKVAEQRHRVDKRPREDSHDSMFIRMTLEVL